MNFLEGKHFSVTDPKGVNTVIYQINKTEKEYLRDHPKYTIERLDKTEELVGENSKKTFYIENLKEESNKLVIFSFAKDRVVINNGVLEENKVRISKKPMPFKFEEINSTEHGEYREVNYTPNLKRPISIIDPETTEEIKPTLYFDENTNEVKGMCKLKFNKSYFVFEIRENDNNINLIGGTPSIKN